jgi:hypothetical protein
MGSGLPFFFFPLKTITRFPDSKTMGFLIAYSQRTSRTFKNSSTHNSLQMERDQSSSFPSFAGFQRMSRPLSGTKIGRLSKKTTCK